MRIPGLLSRVGGWGFPMAMLTDSAGQGLLALGAVLSVRARAAASGDPREQAVAATA